MLLLAPPGDLGHERFGIRLASVTRLNGIDQREVARKGESRYVGVAGRVHGDAMPLVFIASAEAGGINEGIALSIQVRDENIRPPCGTRAGLDGMLGGEVAGGGSSYEQSIAEGIHRDPIAKVIVAPTEVSGINQGAARRVELGDKRIRVPSGAALERTVRRGKDLQKAGPADVGVAGSIHRARVA